MADQHPFKYVPINAFADVNEEKEKILSGYYIDINKQLEILAESFNENFEQNPFEIAERQINEYLEGFRGRNKPDKTRKVPIEKVQTTDITEAGIPTNENLDTVFENMSPEDLNVIENILSNEMKDAVQDVNGEMIDPEDCAGKFEESGAGVGFETGSFAGDEDESGPEPENESEPEIENESDSETIVLSQFPNHNCMELGAAKTLLNLRKN